MALRRLASAAALTAGLVLVLASTSLAAPGEAPAPLDTSFGVAGTQVLPQGFEHGSEFAIQPDGKAVFAGNVGQPRRFGLHRLDADGAVDSTFGAAGTATLSPGPTPLDSGRANVAVQADGRIVVAAPTSWSSGNQKWVLARALPDGKPDNSFSGDSRLTVTFPGVVSFYLPIGGLVVDHQGRITIVGAAQGKLLAARLLPDGSLDHTFGTAGRLVMPLPGQFPAVTAAVVDPAGRVVVGGYVALPDSGYDMIAARLTSAGALDSTFGVNGIAYVDSGLAGSDMLTAMDIDDSGRVLLAGVFGQTTDIAHPGVARLLPDGGLDHGFGTYGRLIVPDGRESDSHFLTGVASLPDGRMAVLGDYIPSYDSGEPHTKTSFAAVLTDSGAPDPAFDAEDGVVVLPHNAVAGSRLTVDGQSRLLVHNVFTVSRLRSSTPTTAMSVTLSTGSPVAGPGPLAMTATVHNAGPLPSASTLTLSGSKPLAVVGRSASLCSTGKTGAITCKWGSVGVGQTATIQLQTVLDGFEGTVFVDAHVTSSVPDVDTSDNTAQLEIHTTTEPTE